MSTRAEALRARADARTGPPATGPAPLARQGRTRRVSVGRRADARGRTFALAAILDTTPAFIEFARKGFLKDPALREELWAKEYEGAYPEVFAVLDARFGNADRISAMARELSKLRRLAERAAPEVAAAIEEMEPAVRELLDADPEPAPRHVLLLGRLGANAFVDRLDGDVAVFHCLEWHTDPEPARVLVAHEDSHAWHRLILGAEPPTEDLAWMAFSEGLALQVSRKACPDRPDYEHFWYGLPGFESWLPWCQEHAAELRTRFAAALDEPDAVETWFGGGLVDEQLRVGFFVADQLVAELGRPLPELARLSVDEARASVREALGA